MKTILEVSQLCVSYPGTSGNAIEGIGFCLQEGSIVALVGGSGSGKTTLCRGLTRLFGGPSIPRVSGSVLFKSYNLTTCSEEELQHLRQSQIRYVFQEPQQTLNPVSTIRTQLGLAAGKRMVHSAELASALRDVGLQDADQILRSYPHQLSVGMAQRVMIAMALLPNPSLLIADEPTSALDASLRYQLLDLLVSFQRQRRLSILLVTHDLDIARRYAHEVAVLHAGTIVEHAAAADFFRQPQHPYSRLLVDSLTISSGGYLAEGTTP